MKNRSPAVSPWQRFIRCTSWMFLNSRPQFHYALVVLFHAGVQLATAWLLLWLFAAFGLLRRLDFALVGFLVGPLALGALAAGHVKAFVAMPERIAQWMVPGTFGGVSVLVFWIIVRLEWDSVDWASCLGAFVVGAALFIVLAWLIRLEQKGEQGPV